MNKQIINKLNANRIVETDGREIINKKIIQVNFSKYVQGNQLKNVKNKANFL